MFKKTKGYSGGGQAKSKGYKTGGKVRKPESNAIETAIRNSIFDPKPTKGPKPKGPRSGKVLFDAKPQESKVRKKPGMAGGGPTKPSDKRVTKKVVKPNRIIKSKSRRSTDIAGPKTGVSSAFISRSKTTRSPRKKPQERKVRKKPGI